jgi:hypothetical protein
MTRKSVTIYGPAGQQTTYEDVVDIRQFDGCLKFKRRVETGKGIETQEYTTNL